LLPGSRNRQNLFDLHLTNDIAWADGAARFVFGGIFVQATNSQ